jgi:hypothetical protein
VRSRCLVCPLPVGCYVFKYRRTCNPLVLDNNNVTKVTPFHFSKAVQNWHFCDIS